MSPTFLPYGDRAILINFEQKIDPKINAQVHQLKAALEQAKIEGIDYLIPAYCSLTVGYQPAVLDYDILIEIIKSIKTQTADTTFENQRKLNIPVCYESPYALDIKDLAKNKGLSIDQIINLHTSSIFKVYMLGFLPGFVFMGKLPSRLECQRKPSPRLRVPPRSVGIAGLQTGIYPSETPGGWQIIGQTPLTIFDPKKANPFLFQAGDSVQFYAISEKEFLEKKNWQVGENDEIRTINEE